MPGTLTHSKGSMSSKDAFDHSCKVILLGDSGVGKTCLLLRFKDGIFSNSSYISTVGIDCKSKVVDVEDAKIRLQIYDTAGQERFRSVTKNYYRDANVLLLIYDITNKQSFSNVRHWLNDAIEHANQKELILMVLGNKVDMEAKRQVPSTEGDTLAKSCGAVFMETSARSGQNVDLAFNALAREFFQQHPATDKGTASNNRTSLDEFVKENQVAERSACWC